MAAVKKKFFNINKSYEKKPLKADPITELKSQLSSIQSKIAEIEGQEEAGVEVKELYKWSSPTHVFVPRGKKWITYVILITALIVLILLFIREFFIIAPVLAVTFLAYILASVPPDDIEHRITSEGFISGKHNYLWEEMYDFWFTKKYGHTLLHIDTLTGFPGRLVVLVNDEEKVKGILLKYLPFREVPKTSWLDSVGDSLSNLFHKIAS